MPIFEYRCEDCGKRSTYLILQGHSSTLSCKHCKGQQLERIMSCFAAPKSEEAPHGSPRRPQQLWWRR